MAARLLNLRRTADLGMRIENLLREPEFVRYLARQDFTNPVVIRRGPRRTVTCRCRSAPYGDGQLLLLGASLAPDASGGGAARFRGERLARVALPLTVISGYLETLGQDPALDPDLHGPVAEMRRRRSA